MAKDKLSVFELNSQLIKGAKEARRVMKPFDKIPPLRRIKTTLTQSREVTVGGGLSAFAALKFDRKREYKAEQSYTFNFLDDEDQELILTADDNAQMLFDGYGLETVNGQIALNAAVDETIAGDSLWGITTESFNEDLPPLWSLQSSNIALDFAGRLVQFLSGAEEYFEDPSFSLDPFEYKATITLSRSSEIGFEISFFDVLKAGGGRESSRAITHQVVATFTRKKS